MSRRHLGPLRAWCAWIVLGITAAPLGMRLGRVFRALGGVHYGPYEHVASPAWAPDASAANWAALGGLMWGWDLGFIAMTIGAFLVLWLLVKGVERFER